MRQIDSNRFEEFITLRDELREALAHGRFILYVTSLLVLGALSWYMGKVEPPHISPAALAIFLDVVLFASSLVYANNLSQALRIGGYIAVFWESRDPDRRLKWHRFNRRGARGGLLAFAAQLTYAVLTLIVVGFLIHLLNSISIEDRWSMIRAIFIGSLEVLFFTQMSRYIATQQRRHEYDWRVIRSSRERQDQIHDEYESIPTSEAMLIRLPSPSLLERLWRAMGR
ncbi:MAG: hypothetical protein Q8R39_01100 [bacterium]|nr:hypothetical protein [bacterium]MDZ4284818.1 hypothetical protein [Patescibacteria group bacterium]